MFLTSPPKTTTTTTNGLITAQWPEPHTHHTLTSIHITLASTPQCDTLPFSELCCVLDDTVATNNPNETPQSTMTPLPASLMEIVIVTRSKIGVHPLQRSEVFRLTRIQAGQSSLSSSLWCFAKIAMLCCATCFKGLHQEEQGKAADYLVHCSSTMHYPHLITSDALVNHNHNMNIKEHYSVAIQSKCTQNLDR